MKAAVDWTDAPREKLITGTKKTTKNKHKKGCKTARNHIAFKLSGMAADQMGSERTKNPQRHRGGLGCGHERRKVSDQRGGHALCKSPGLTGSDAARRRAIGAHGGTALGWGSTDIPCTPDRRNSWVCGVRASVGCRGGWARRLGRQHHSVKGLDALGAQLVREALHYGVLGPHRRSAVGDVDDDERRIEADELGFAIVSRVPAGV